MSANPNAAMEQLVADVSARVQQRLLAEQAPGYSTKDIVAYLRQFTRWRFKTPVDPDDYRWANVLMKATVTTAASSPATQNYRAPANFHMLIFGIEGHLAFNAITSETLSITGIGNPDVANRMLIKSMNARLAFTNTDRNGGTKIFENNSVALSSILPSVGGEPLKFNPPHVVPNGENLALDITMNDTTAAIIGASTDYGVNLKALFVRARE